MRKTQYFGLPLDFPQIIMDAGQVIIQQAKLRYSLEKQPTSKPCYFLKKKNLGQSYQQAKRAETAERNLVKAILFYAKSASQGEKIDSCIKDFASIIHQMGYTQHAVQFLAELRHYYDSDLNTYDQLKLTLERQLIPTGKHYFKCILFEFPNQCKPTQQFIQSLFQNTNKIHKITVLNHLTLTEPTQQIGKWFVFQFKSFSDAKQTLQTFRFQQWFGVNKYWVGGNLITCEATDGRQDFQKGYVVTSEMIEINLYRYWDYNEIMLWNESQRLNCYNQCAKMLIEGHLEKTAPFLNDEILNNDWVNFK